LTGQSRSPEEAKATHSSRSSPARLTVPAE
jgi:hypothetical protein